MPERGRHSLTVRVNTAMRVREVARAKGLTFSPPLCCRSTAQEARVGLNPILLYMGRMKKDSNRRVRWILVQAARSASRTDPRMRQLYEKVASRRGDNKAVIRVANKMATIIWHMSTKRQPYHQVKEELYRSKLKKDGENSMIVLARRQSSGEPTEDLFIGGSSQTGGGSGRAPSTRRSA